MTAVLSAAGVTRRFGAVHAVDGVDLQVHAGARHALIGPNGAGKSTLLQLLSGVQPVSEGTVWLGDQDVTGMPETRRSRLGLVQTFQHSSLFPTMTALENVVLAAQRGHGVRLWPRRRVRRTVEARAEALLATVDLAGEAGVRVGALAHGQRRQLEIAVALACEPRVLLLDEPSAGMSAGETDQLAGMVEHLPDEVTVLFVEHDLDVVFRLATHVTVLHLGAVLLTGSPEEARASSAVQEAYLGTGTREDLFLPPDGDPSEGDADGGQGGRDVPART